MRKLLLICLAMLIPACRRGALDDEQLDVYSRTGMVNAEVTYSDGYAISLKPVEYDLMRSLISSLRPIKSVERGTLDDYDYRLMYFAGMDPAIIKVKLVDATGFVYQWDDFIYHGGNSQSFLETVNSIRSRDQSRLK
jgi:hypothetical protein